jgi:hypothetical protein
MMDAAVAMEWAIGFRLLGERRYFGDGDIKSGVVLRVTAIPIELAKRSTICYVALGDCLACEQFSAVFTFRENFNFLYLGKTSPQLGTR